MEKMRGFSQANLTKDFSDQDCATCVVRNSCRQINSISFPFCTVQGVHRPEVAEGFKNTGGERYHEQSAKQTTTYRLPEIGMTQRKRHIAIKQLDLIRQSSKHHHCIKNPLFSKHLNGDAGSQKIPRTSIKALCSPNLREQR